MPDSVADVLVIGAGVVGLAIARRLAERGLEVVLVEKEATFGVHTSSRNSEVIHAGLYYPVGSLKAEMCLRGRDQIYQYCRQRGIPHRQTGKLVVASDSDEVEALEAIHQNAQDNGCEEIYLSTCSASSLYADHLRAEAFLASPMTGIIDSHQFMLSLLGDFERHGGVVSWKTEAVSIERGSHDAIVKFKAGYELSVSTVINAAGLSAIDFLPQKWASYGYLLAKGDYFAYAGKMPFSHLIYPVPQVGGLGIHLTLDMAGNGRFGPDVTWVQDIDYLVDGSKSSAFAQAIERYWPGVSIEALSPSYSGIRPKVALDGRPLNDFLILSDRHSPTVNEIHLLGIESPGLTSSLSLADYVLERVY